MVSTRGCARILFGTMLQRLGVSLIVLFVLMFCFLLIGLQMLVTGLFIILFCVMLKDATT